MLPYTHHNHPPGVDEEVVGALGPLGDGLGRVAQQVAKQLVQTIVPAAVQCSGAMCREVLGSCAAGWRGLGALHGRQRAIRWVLNSGGSGGAQQRPAPGAARWRGRCACGEAREHVIGRGCVHCWPRHRQVQAAARTHSQQAHTANTAATPSSNHSSRRSLVGDVQRALRQGAVPARAHTHGRRSARENTMRLCA